MPAQPSVRVSARVENFTCAIRDIVTEGSSLVANYQQQFNRIIKKDGFAELMRRMKKRLASGSAE